MNEEILREKIYEYLCLEFGSLSSESGNDWERAKKDVLDDYRREQNNSIHKNKEINLLTIDKNSSEFIYILNSHEPALEYKREHISHRMDLSHDEISILINNSSKEILINLVKNYSLSESLINKILDKSVYLVLKYIIEKQTLSESNIVKVQAIMQRDMSFYRELYNSIALE